MGLSPHVDGIELDNTSEFDVFGGVWNINLVFDVLVEENWDHAVNADVSSDFSTETAAVVLQTCKI